MVATEHAAGAAYACLNLVGHEKYIIFFAEFVALLKITLVRYIYAGFSLYGLD